MASFPFELWVCHTKGTGTQVTFSQPGEGITMSKLSYIQLVQAQSGFAKDLLASSRERDSSSSLHPQNKRAFPEGFFSPSALHTNKLDPLRLSSC